MWGVLAKLGGGVLSAIGIDWAISAYQESAAEAAQREKNQQIGKGIVGAAAIYLAYLLLKKMK